MGCVPEAERVSGWGRALGASSSMRHFQCVAEAQNLWSTHKNSDLGVLNEGFSFMGQTQAGPVLTACPISGRS